MLGIDLKNPLENVVQLVRDGENGLQKAPITHVSTEGGVLHGGVFPRVAATCQVDQDHTKRPDIVGS